MLVTGRLYDREALRQLKAQGLTRKPGQDLTCKGVSCYRLAFIIITVVNLFGTLVSAILVVRTRKFYQGDIYKKFRDLGANNKSADEADIVCKPAIGVLPLTQIEPTSIETTTKESQAHKSSS